MNHQALWLKQLTIAACISLILGCDQSNDSQNSASQTAPMASITTSSNENIETDAVTSNPLTESEKKQLVNQYQQTQFTVVDASEQQINGASTLVVTFSMPIEADQDFSQLVRLVDNENGHVEGGWVLSKNRMELHFPYLDPDRVLILTIMPQLTSLTGKTLLTRDLNTYCDEHAYASEDDCREVIADLPYQVDIETRNTKPMVSFASQGSLLPSNMIAGLPIQTLNVNQVDVNFYRVKPGAIMQFIKDWQKSAGLSYWHSEKVLKNVELVYTGRFELNPRRNQRETQLLPLKEVEAVQEQGVYFAVMNEAGAYRYTNPATLFTISNTGLSVHRYQNKMAVFAQALTSGEALKQVTVELIDKEGKTLGTQQTDAQGMAIFTQLKDARVMVAHHGKATTLLVLDRSALDLTEFEINGEPYYDKQLFVFGPRDLYRPGETVKINALLRDADGQPLPSQPIQVEVLKPDNQVLRTFVWQPHSGLYQYDFQLGEDIPTGKWALRFNVGDDQYRFYHFSVEEFLPERMAMEIQPTSEKPLLANKSVYFDIKGWYLYGAPASGNTLQGQIYLRSQREVPNAQGFEVGNIQHKTTSRRVDELDLTLDDSGITRLVLNDDIQDTLSNFHDVVSVWLQASLLDTGGRPINRLVSQTVWPYAALPAVRLLMPQKESYDYQSNRTVTRATVDEDSLASFEVAYLDRDGHKLAADALDVRLVKERRDYYWHWSDEDGWQSNYNQKDIVMARQTVSVEKEQAATVQFPVEWGAYRVEVRHPEANQYVTSARFYAGYSWQDNTQGSGAVRPDQVKLKLDKPHYQLGDIAKVNVMAPSAGQGYLLVESNEGPLWQQAINVPAEGATFDVPIAKDWQRHDLYLNAIVVRPGDKTTQATTKRAIGLLHLPLQTAERKLNFAIDVPSQIRPKQTFKVKIKSDSLTGVSPENVTVLLSAVDSGVLNITDFETPDPYHAFLGRKRYLVDQLDVYGQLIEGQGKLGKLKFGGDSDDELTRGGKKAPAIVNIVAQQQQPVQLDKNGEAVIPLTIPDFNGELRLMAQVWSDNRYGKAEKKVKVAAPLIAELSTPRFLASGDKSNFTLSLRNLTDSPQKIRVEGKISGLLAFQPEATSRTTVELAPKASHLLTYPVTALSGYGQGQLSVKVTGLTLPENKDAILQRNWAVSVRPAYPAKTASYHMTLNQNDSWMLSENALSHLAKETLNGQLSLSSRPPLNLARYVQALYAYPYGCAEQTTSGLYPTLYANQSLLSQLGIKSQTDETRRQRIRVGIERLLGMQGTNGGFGLWSNTSEEDFWLTAYVTDFLLRAKTQGFIVSDNTLSQAIKRLQRYIQDPSVIRGYGDPKHQAQLRFSVQAYAALVLAQQNQISLSAVRQLAKSQDKAISGLALVQLGRALQIAGDNQKGLSLMEKGLKLPREHKHYIGDFGSKLRDNALMLALLQESDQLPHTWDEQLYQLSADLNSKQYLSTQERNAVFLAGRRQLDKGGQPWTIQLNQQSMQSDKPLTTLLDSTSIEKGVQLSNSDQTKVYGRLDIVGYPIHKPAPEQHNLTITRQFYNMDGELLDLNRLKSGDLVFVSLHLTADERVHDALVVDLLPAGLELENQNLAKTSLNLQESSEALNTLVNAMQNTVIKYQEYRDDRYVAAIEVPKTYQYSRGTQLVYLARAVTPGQYVMPAPYVESMYRPEWFAIGKTPDQLRILP